MNDCNDKFWQTISVNSELFLNPTENRALKILPIAVVWTPHSVLSCCFADYLHHPFFALTQKQSTNPM